MKFTRYQSLFKTNEPEIIEFHQFVSELTTHSPIFDEIRNETVKERKDYLKKNLPGYCFAGIFGTRSDRGFNEHSGMAVIDLDKIPTAKFTQEFTAICKLPFTLAAWRSPSGNGIKALIRIPKCNSKEHSLRLRTFAIYYTSEYIDLDADICRFCFASYDPNPYINESAEEFTLMFSEADLNAKADYNNEVVNAIGDEAKIVKIIANFKRATEFVDGQRNKHTFSIASHFCEYGVKKETCIQYLTNNVWSADFVSEGLKAVNSAYRIRKANSKQLEDRDKLQSVDTLEYPFEIFPEKIRESIFDVSRELSLNPIFLATAGLWTCSSLAGNAYQSEFNTKNILFCMMIAPVSVGKTPAFKAMCEQPLSDTLEREDAEFKRKLEEWNAEKMAALGEKKQFTKARPRRFHPFAVDGTTEGYIALCQDQPNGMGVYHDEAETILNAGAHKSNNDSISFFTQAFSGGRYTQIRADREKERVVQNLNINLLMGTQPSRLTNIFTMDKIESGFASRFLMVESDYIHLNTNSNPFAQSRRMCAEWSNLVLTLYDVNKSCSNGDNPQTINVLITDEAKALYTKYYQLGLTEANTRIDGRIDQYIIGAEAKMSAYLPRLTQLIAIINNHKTPYIDESIVELGYKLYRYHAQSTVRILRSLHKTVETGLPLELDNLYTALPEEFSYKEAKEVCAKINLPDDKFKSSIRRKDFSKLFVKTQHGKYKKVH